MHAIFYMHQTSGACAGVCACDCMHQLDKITRGSIIQHKQGIQLCYGGCHDIK